MSSPHSDCPEAPVFHPTAKEFQHPAKYIESIAEKVRPYGICKIVPPASWKPPFMLNKGKFKFRTRVQQINYLDGQTRLRLSFVEALCRFHSKQGQPLERLPIVGNRILDLATLYREVTVRGGFTAVTEGKQWAEVARALELQTQHGAVIKQHYEKILLQYELHKAKEEAERAQNEGQHTEGTVQLPKDLGGQRTKDLFAKAVESKEEASGQKTEQFERSRITREFLRQSQEAEGSKKQDKEGKEDKDAEGDEEAEEDSDGDDDGTVGFGYHDGTKYSLSSYKTMADRWKVAFFGKNRGQISLQEVEEKYWETVMMPERMVEVEYGSELHTTTHGSAFPTYGNSLNPLDAGRNDSYSRNLWNLNNLNQCTLLQYIKEDISGVLSPWIYVGMCFSTFCWHNEDHYLYSINYLWQGEPKQWYGVSGDDADKFEQAMREYAPELFEMQPDLLFQLVTMISPRILQEKGVNVYRQTQHQGDIMLTFPRAYHGGFNYGYNVAESCNFALRDWLPWGRMSDLHYRKLNRVQVFSHQGFLVSLAEDDSSVHTAMFLLPDIIRYQAEENAKFEQLKELGMHPLRIDPKRRGILSHAILGTTVEEEGQIIRKPVAKGKKKNKSMRELRRARAPSVGADTELDECAVCRGSTFLYQVRCTCDTTRVSCLQHASELCGCDSARKTVEYWFSEDEIQQLITSVHNRAVRPTMWLRKAAELLASGRQPVKLYKAMVEEAEKFPLKYLPEAAGLVQQMKDRWNNSKDWVEQAIQLIATVQSKSRQTADQASLSVTDIENVINAGLELMAIPDEVESLQVLVSGINVWREKARNAIKDYSIDLSEVKYLLAESDNLKVRTPEGPKLKWTLDYRRWANEHKEVCGKACPIKKVSALVQTADETKFHSAEANGLRADLHTARAWESKLLKARERGSSLTSLKTLLEEVLQTQYNGPKIVLEEVKETEKVIRECEKWSEKVRVVVACESGKPDYPALESLRTEYASLGIHMDLYDQVRLLTNETRSWIKRAKSTAGHLLTRVENHSSNGCHGYQNGSSSDTKCSVGEKRASEDHLVQAASKKAKVIPVSLSATSAYPTIENVHSLLADASKLGTTVPQADSLQKGLNDVTLWKRKSYLALNFDHVTGSSVNMLTELLREGINLGVQLEGEGRELSKRIWQLRVQACLGSPSPEPGQILALKGEGEAQSLQGEQHYRSLEDAVLALKKQGCFCRRIELDDTESIFLCKLCGVRYHKACLGMAVPKKQMPMPLSPEADGAVCVPCKRKSATTRRAVLPAGWQQCVDASTGTAFYANLLTGGRQLELPFGTVFQEEKVQVRPYADNACLKRVTDNLLCQVCFQEGEDDDPKGTCSECGLLVHLACYGLEGTDMVGSTFVCTPCHYGVKDPPCQLCSLSGGAAKPTSQGGWSHVACATWTPDTFFEDTTRMDIIGGLETISKERRKQPCSICKTKKGVTINCKHKNCKVAWHPLCGLEYGYHMVLAEDEKNPDEIKYISLCPKHAPEEDNQLYCICRKKYREGDFMIECEQCNEWFHGACVGVTEEESESLTDWRCSSCHLNQGAAERTSIQNPGKNVDILTSRSRPGSHGDDV